MPVKKGAKNAVHSAWLQNLTFDRHEWGGSDGHEELKIINCWEPKRVPKNTQLSSE